MANPNPGLTIYICFGRYGGFGIRRDMGIRITLGWVSVALVFLDIERLAGNALSAGLKYKLERDELMKRLASYDITRKETLH